MGVCRTPRSTNQEDRNRGHALQVTQFDKSDVNDERNKENCKNQCLAEPDCRFATYAKYKIPGQDIPGRCTYLKQKTCSLFPYPDQRIDFTTFIKKGLFYFIYVYY